MYEIGRLCIKIAGRDARKKCLVVDVLEGSYVLIDGQTRRKKCNIAHLEPTSKVLKIKKGIDHAEVVEALKKEGIEVQETKAKEKAHKPTKAAKPKAQKAQEKPKAEKKAKASTEEKAQKPKAKKETKKTAKKE